MIKKTGGILGKAIAAILSIVILALIGIGVMLSHGPVSIAPLVPYLENVLDDPSWRFRVRIEDAVLSWEGWQRKLDVRVKGARFVNREGADLISVPSLSIAFDTRALLAGQFRVTGLELIAPRLQLFRHEDGRIEITNRQSGENGGGQARAGQGFTFDPGTLNDPGQDANFAIFGDLRRVSVRQANLSFHDAKSGLDLSVPSADLGLQQENDSVGLRLSTRLRIGQSEAALGISALYRNDASPIVVAMNFAEVDIAGLAEAIGGKQLTQLRGLQLIAAGRLDASLQPGGVVERLDFDVTTGGGQVNFPQLGIKEIPVGALAAKGTLANNLAHLSLTDVRLDLRDGLTVQGGGEWEQTGDGPSLRAKGRFQNLPAMKLSRYWPENLAVDARHWVLANLRGGVAHKGSFGVDLRPGDLQRDKPRAGIVQLDWSFHDVTTSYFGDLPPIQSARGSGHVDGQEFRLTLDSATVGSLQLGEGSLLVADILNKSPFLDVDFVVRGAVKDALTLLDAEPLGFAKALAIRPEDAGGMSATRAHFKIPLHAGLTLAQVGYSAASNIADLSLLRTPGGYSLKGGEFKLTVEKDALQMSGQGAVNGIPMQLDWKRDFQAGQDAPGDYLTVRTRATTEQWMALGLPPLPLVRGVVGVAVSIDAYRDGSRRGAGRFDLTAAEIDLSAIAWRKAASAPAEMQLTFQTETSGETVIDYWEIASRGIIARGRAKLDARAGLVSLQADKLSLGKNRLVVDMTALTGGGYRLNLAGASLDLRPFISRWQDDAMTAVKEPPLELKLQVDQVFLTDDVIISRVRGGGARRDGNWLRANMRGLMAGGQSVGFTVQPEGGGRRFVLAAGDAGGMARALGLYQNARGGVMYLNFLVPDRGGPEAAITGQLRADNFRVVRAPVLTRLLTLGSLQGLGDLLNDKGIAFTRLDVPFRLRGDELHMERARAVGPALALIATGDYQHRTRELQFQGTIVPSYTINSVLGAIPILGNLLIGRKGEGVFAFTYTIAGSLEKPKVSVNLLSALAPGFLRRIVEGLDSPAVDDAGPARVNPDR